MIRPLGAKHVQKANENVRRYAGLELTDYVSSLYQYSRGDRPKFGNHDFAVTTEEDGGRIYLEMPLTDKLCDNCLSFVVLHELAHVTGVRDHRRATTAAVTWLWDHGAISPEWIRSVKRRWTLAGDQNALNGAANIILESRGLTKNQAKNLYLRANACLERGKPIPLELDVAYDEAKISLLCRSELPDVMKDMITKLGSFWAEYPDRAKPRGYATRYWERLISKWAEDVSLPLYVRKPSLGRGRELQHPKGRIIVPTDNSPARWAFIKAWRGETPSLKEIARMIKNDEIPVMRARSRKEKRRARYGRTLKELEKENPISKEWKVGHIDPLGLKVRGSPTNIELVRLKNHFLKLMKPSNMFVVPKDYGGLAELPDFCRQMR